MSRHKVEICGLDTSQLPVLSHAVMRQLFKDLQDDLVLEARDTLIHGNLRLVLSVVQRFAHRTNSVDDLFQVGCIGLMKAIDHFDLGQNVRFSTYAVPMIIGEIRRYLRDNNPIRVSRSLRDIAYKALQARDRLVLENNREPTMSEIAALMDAKPEDVMFALDAIQDPVSLYEPVFQDGGDPIYMMDQIGDDRITEREWMNNIQLEQALNRLNQREKHIVSKRFFQGKTQMEVAEEIGISQAQVSRLEKSAIKQMKQMIQ